MNGAIGGRPLIRMCHFSLFLSDCAADQILDKVQRSGCVGLCGAVLPLYQDYPRLLPVPESTQ